MEKVLKKFINTGQKVQEKDLINNITKAFSKMGHTVIKVDAKYLGYFATKRSQGLLRHHYMMNAHIRLKPGSENQAMRGDLGNLT